MPNLHACCVPAPACAHTLPLADLTIYWSFTCLLGSRCYVTNCPSFTVARDPFAILSLSPGPQIQGCQLVQSSCLARCCRRLSLISSLPCTLSLCLLWPVLCFPPSSYFACSYLPFTPAPYQSPVIPPHHLHAGGFHLWVNPIKH